MNIKFAIACLLFLCASFPLSAQKEKQGKDIQIIEFGEEDQTATRKPQNHNGLIVKTNPISFVFGAQWVEAEKEINDYLSLQAGIGARFKSLVGYSYTSLFDELNGSDDACNSTVWSDDICDEYTDYTYRESKVGPLLYFSPRLFFESGGFDGGYIAPVLRYSKAKYKVQQVDETATSEVRLPNVWQKENERDIDLVIHFGYQRLHPKLTSEIFFGIGARFNKSTRQDLGRNDLGFYQNGVRNFQRTILRIESGIRLGFQL